MKQEDKELLLKDLCARLPYIPIIQIKEHNWNNIHINTYDTPFRSYYLIPFIIGEIEIKPYLRPMPDIQDKALEELNDLITNKKFYEIISISQDWLNEHHFDYRGLISKGLAIEAPDGMYE